MRLRVAKRDNGSYVVQKRFLIFWWKNFGIRGFWGDHAEEEALHKAKEIFALHKAQKRRKKGRRIVKTLDVN